MGVERQFPRVQTGNFDIKTAFSTCLTKNLAQNWVILRQKWSFLGHFYAFFGKKRFWSKNGQKWPFLSFSRGTPGKMTKLPKIIGNSRGFFRVFSRKMAFFAILGTCHQKEEKAIALRSHDIYGCVFGCAMQWTQVK